MNPRTIAIYKGEIIELSDDSASVWMEDMVGYKIIIEVDPKLLKNSDITQKNDLFICYVNVNEDGSDVDMSFEKVTSIDPARWAELARNLKGES